jgi:phage terminase large subunit-like protein
VTTTPRRIALIRRMLDDPATVVTRAATRANAGHLSQGFLAEMERRYGGTSLGRQELDGELLEDRDDALWTRAMIEAQRVAAAPPLARIVVAIDPPASAAAAGACGLVAVGIAGDGHLYVLEDRTLTAARPAQWAAEAAALYHRLGADRIVAEVNQGGDMVEAVLREIDASLPITKVRASRGKWVRAEPVAALYEQGRVSHVGQFPALEDQLCDFTTAGLSNGRSPDRLDALVWAVSSLAVLKGAPRIRAFS